MPYSFSPHAIITLAVLTWSCRLLCTSMAAEARAAETRPLRFDFGAGPHADGFTVVTPTNQYTSGAGFGFEAGVTLRAHARCVTSDQPFLFSVKLPEGNHRVSITLGDESAESSTTVKAEARRLMLEGVRTSKGQSVNCELIVNIRTPLIAEGRSVRLKQREKDTEMVSWDERLTLEFNGPRPCLRTLEITPAPDAPTIFLAGDSTVCDQPREPWNSWGQMLPRFF